MDHVYADVSLHFMFTVFVVNVVLCYASTTEMSANVNGCLLILIRRLLFINLRLCGLMNVVSKQR